MERGEGSIGRMLVRAWGRGAASRRQLLTGAQLLRRQGLADQQPPAAQDVHESEELRFVRHHRNAVRGEDEEMMAPTDFGWVRLDSMNQPTAWGQDEAVDAGDTADRSLQDGVSSSGVKAGEQQAVAGRQAPRVPGRAGETGTGSDAGGHDIDHWFGYEDHTDAHTKRPLSDSHTDDTLFEQQFFGDASSDLHMSSKTHTTRLSERDTVSHTSDTHNFIEEQFFNNMYESEEVSNFQHPFSGDDEKLQSKPNFFEKEFFGDIYEGQNTSSDHATENAINTSNDPFRISSSHTQVDRSLDMFEHSESAHNNDAYRKQMHTINGQDESIATETSQSLQPPAHLAGQHLGESGAPRPTDMDNLAGWFVKPFQKRTKVRWRKQGAVEARQRQEGAPWPEEEPPELPWQPAHEQDEAASRSSPVVTRAATNEMVLRRGLMAEAADQSGWFDEGGQGETLLPRHPDKPRHIFPPPVDKRKQNVGIPIGHAESMARPLKEESEETMTAHSLPSSGADDRRQHQSLVSPRRQMAYESEQVSSRHSDQMLPESIREGRRTVHNEAMPAGYTAEASEEGIFPPVYDLEKQHQTLIARRAREGANQGVQKTPHHADEPRTKVRTSAVRSLEPDEEAGTNLGRHPTASKAAVQQAPNPDEEQLAVAASERALSAHDLRMSIKRQMRVGSQQLELDPQRLTVQPRSAAEHSGKYEVGAGKLDSKGFRVLSDQVLDVQYQTIDDMVTHLLSHCILYQDDDLVAINKPYDLPSIVGPKVHLSVDRLRAPLAAKLGCKDLHVVHRLDKQTTGVMLLAKNKATARALCDMFSRRQVVKQYLVITKGIPDPPQGIIDIPITMKNIDGRDKMWLAPETREYNEMLREAGKKQKRQAQTIHPAVTNYTVLHSASQCALVLLQPESGIRHQIRCHLGFGLNTPVLGDHKYSDFDGFRPQTLEAETLQRLGVRQSKVRHMPMHLHAKQLILPEYRNGKSFFVSAVLPPHFRQTMKWLRLVLLKR